MQKQIRLFIIGNYHNADNKTHKPLYLNKFMLKPKKKKKKQTKILKIILKIMRIGNTQN